MSNLGGWAGPGMLLWAQWCFPLLSKRGGPAYLLKCPPFLLKCPPCPTPPSRSSQHSLEKKKPSHLAAGPREPGFSTSRPILTMVPAWLWLLCLSIPQALPKAQSAELYVEVPENYGGNFPLYLIKLPLPREKAEGQIVLSGSSNVAVGDLFAVDPDSGFLLVTRALDREEQAEYQLQVTLEAEPGHVLWGPQPVHVHVRDENDQVPHFSQAIYRVQLSQGTRPGIPFLFLEASDGDEPGTANSDLRFRILNQAPAHPFPDMFKLEPWLGALALSPKGSTSLDQTLEGPYQLLIQVKDMGDQASGHQATATVDVSIVESTWVPQDPVHLVENLKVPYPHHIFQFSSCSGAFKALGPDPQPFTCYPLADAALCCDLLSFPGLPQQNSCHPLLLAAALEIIAQARNVSGLLEEQSRVHWSGGDVHYYLESQPPGPFNVDAEGKLYVTRELDREAQAEYLLQVRAQNTRGEDYTEPLELQVVVMDENDNAPLCPQRGPPISLPELSPPGTKVTRLLAEDMDAPGSPNSHVVYRLLSPELEEGTEGRAFELDSTTGSVTLGALPLHAGQHIQLQVLAVDLGGAEGGLSSMCEVTVTVMDINDHAPEFTTSQIEPISLPEDTEPGTLVAILTATDADLEPAFRLMDFAIEAGNMDGTFGLDWEPGSGQVQLRLLKSLSYEAAPSHELIVVVRSVAPLVGPGAGPRATATVTVLVERVLPLPKLDQESYEASVPVNSPAGSFLLTIQPSDPTSRPLRFSLVNDSEGWLCIREVSGEVLTARPLQGARPGDMYTVLVEAQDADEPALSTSVTLVVHFLKGPSALAPTLALEPTRHLCTPRKNHGVVVSGPSEDADLGDGHGPYSFALGPNPTVQRDWHIQTLNGSHAYLTLALHWVEPREYLVPVIVSQNAQMWQLLVRVIVCRCNKEGQCLRKVGHMKGMPTKLSAVGILVGTLLAIGIFLILIFTHLTLARKKDLDQPVDSVPLKAVV